MSALSTLRYYTLDEVGCNTLRGFFSPFSPLIFFPCSNFQVAVHATSESCWVLLWDYVYDITKLLVSRPPHAAKSILSVAGKDISHLFEHGRSLGISDLNVREFSIGTASHPITALIAPRSGLRALAFPSRQAPDDRTDKAPLSPWWQDETLIVGRLASKLRKIIVKNVLTGHEHFMEVPSEEILADVRKRYLEFNRQAEDCIWRALKQNEAGNATSFELDMNSTLEANGIADDTENFDRKRIAFAPFVPVLYLHFTDSSSAQ